MNNILKIPAFQRKKAIPKQLKDLELLPLNEEFSKLTMPIVSDDDLRPVMMGNYFDLEKRKIASTDAHKLIAINMPNETFNYISDNYKEELQKEPKGLIFHTLKQLQKYIGMALHKCLANYGQVRGRLISCYLNCVWCGQYGCHGTCNCIANSKEVRMIF